MPKSRTSTTAAEARELDRSFRIKVCDEILEDAIAMLSLIGLLKDLPENYTVHGQTLAVQANAIVSMIREAQKQLGALAQRGFDQTATGNFK